MTLSPASVLEYLLWFFLISRGQIWWESERCHTKLLWAHLHTHRQNSKPTVFSQGILFRNLPGKGVMKSQKICGVRQSIEREVRRSFLFVRLKRKNMWAWLSLSVQKSWRTNLSTRKKVSNGATFITTIHLPDQIGECVQSDIVKKKKLKNESVNSEESFKRCDIHHYDTFTRQNRESFRPDILREGYHQEI